MGRQGRRAGQILSQQAESKAQALLTLGRRARLRCDTGTPIIAASGFLTAKPGPQAATCTATQYRAGDCPAQPTLLAPNTTSCCCPSAGRCRSWTCRSDAERSGVPELPCPAAAAAGPAAVCCRLAAPCSAASAPSVEVRFTPVTCCLAAGSAAAAAAGASTAAAGASTAAAGAGTAAAGAAAAPFWPGRTQSGRCRCSRWRTAMSMPCRRWSHSFTCRGEDANIQFGVRKQPSGLGIGMCLAIGCCAGLHARSPHIQHCSHSRRRTNVLETRQPSYTPARLVRKLVHWGRQVHL